MSEKNTGNVQKIALISAGAGVLLFVFLLLLGQSFGAALIVGILLALLVAIILWISFFDEAPEAEDAPKAEAAKTEAVKAPAAKKAPAKKAPAKKAPAKKAPAKKPAAKPAAKKAAATKAAPKKAAPKKAAPKKAAPAAVGTEPTELMLKKARGNKADNLKDLKGVGPKIETQLHENGFFHFDQVAKLKKKEVEWLDDKLVGSSAAQISDWVAQAKKLAKAAK